MARRLYMDESVISGCGYVKTGEQPESAANPRVLHDGEMVFRTSTIRSWN